MNTATMTGSKENRKDILEVKIMRDFLEKKGYKYLPFKKVDSDPPDFEYKIGKLKHGIELTGYYNESEKKLSNIKREIWKKVTNESKDLNIKIVSIYYKSNNYNPKKISNAILSCLKKIKDQNIERLEKELFKPSYKLFFNPELNKEIIYKNGANKNIIFFSNNLLSKHIDYIEIKTGENKGIYSSGFHFYEKIKEDRIADIIKKKEEKIKKELGKYKKLELLIHINQFCDGSLFEIDKDLLNKKFKSFFDDIYIIFPNELYRLNIQ